MTAEQLIKLLKQVKPDSKVVVIETGRIEIEITGFANTETLFAHQTTMPPKVQLKGVKSK